MALAGLVVGLALSLTGCGSVPEEFLTAEEKVAASLGPYVLAQANEGIAALATSSGPEDTKARKLLEDHKRTVVLWRWNLATQRKALKAAE